MSKVFKKIESGVIDFTIYHQTENQYLMESVEAIVQKTIKEKGYCSDTDLLDIIDNVIEENKEACKEELDYWMDEAKDHLVDSLYTKNIKGDK